MLKENFLKTKLDSNLQTLGTWSIINSHSSIDVITSTNIDFIIFDYEHGNFPFEDLHGLVSVAELNNVSPILRISNIDESQILKALDIGIHGIQIPCINSLDEINKIISYSKFPPIGHRGLSPFTRAGQYDSSNTNKLIEYANKNTLIIIGIENEKSINMLPEFLANDLIDVVFVGLYDLSKSLGIPGNIEDPKVIDLLDKATSIVHQHRKKIGSIATSSSSLKFLKKKKLDYITYSVDTGILKNSYSEIAKKFHE